MPRAFQKVELWGSREMATRKHRAACDSSIDLLCDQRIDSSQKYSSCILVLLAVCGFTLHVIADAEIVIGGGHVRE